VLADVKPVSVTLSGVPASFDLRVHCQGIEVYGDVGATSTDGSYTFTLKKGGVMSGSNTFDILVYVNDTHYGEYTIDFTTGSATKTY